MNQNGSLHSTLCILPLAICNHITAGTSAAADGWCTSISSVWPWQNALLSPTYFLEHCAEKDSGKTTNVIETADMCISTALASRLSVSMLSFGGRRDIETFHTKGWDSTNGWKSRWTLDNPSPSNTVMLLDRYMAGALWVQMRCCVL